MMTTERRSDYHYGYDAGYADAKSGDYETPVGTADYNRGYNEGAGHWYDFQWTQAGTEE